MTDIPVVISSAGAQPTPPAQLLASLVASVSSTNPGYTVVLPGSLIEDISSTDVGALVMCDTARVETLNSLSPYTANDFLLAQLGQIYIGPGAAPAVPTNTSVYVVFSAEDTITDAPLPGYVIPVGFTVSDGTYQYIVQDGGVTASSGITEPLFCLATVAGSWAVPTNTVSTVITSVPTGYSVTCLNPLPGVSGGPAETASEYRARVLQAGQAISTGTTAQLKTLLGQVPGVQQRLVSTVAQVGGGWTIIAGGGDPYLTAGAIFAAGLDVSVLVAAPLSVTNITNAANAVVTTATNHNYTTGQQASISGIVGMTALNGVNFTATVLTEKTFSIGVNTSGYPAYVSGGVLSQNPINVTPNIVDPPNIYGIPFVNPPEQTVAINVTYNTTAPNFTSQAAVAQLAAPAIAGYVNDIAVGAPMSLVILETTFAAAIESVLDPSLLSALTFTVSINGIVTAPTGQLIFGDPYSYFEATTAGIVVTQT